MRAQGGRLDVYQVIHNDQYSSFRTIEQLCRNRGISPCRFGFIPNSIRTGSTKVHKDANLSDKSKIFSSSVDSDSNFDNDQWYDNWLQGDIDNKISSFYMNFDVAPKCYKAVGTQSCDLCLDGGAYLQSFPCTELANPPTDFEGWVEVDAAQKIWVFFNSGSNSPARLGNRGSQDGAPPDYRLMLENYRLVYPGERFSFDIEWRYDPSAGIIWFENAVPGAF